MTILSCPRFSFYLIDGDWGKSGYDYEKNDADFILTLPGGEKYLGVFFTLASVAEELGVGQDLTGVSASSCFWCEGAIIVRSMREEDLFAALEELLKKGEVEHVLAPQEE